jgi:hypothetical protein
MAFFFLIWAFVDSEKPIKASNITFFIFSLLIKGRFTKIKIRSTLPMH